MSGNERAEIEDHIVSILWCKSITGGASLEGERKAVESYCLLFVTVGMKEDQGERWAGLLSPLHSREVPQHTHQLPVLSSHTL